MSPRLRLTIGAALATAAGSTALGAAFSSLRWFGPALVAIAVVAATLEVCRRMHLPGVLGPLVAAAALLVFITRGFAATHAWFGFVPTGETLRELANLARDGFHDMGDLAAPAPATPGLVVITAVGIGLLAMVVDLVAVTMRRPALAGLPLLAVYCVGSAVSPDGAGWVPFAFGAAGYETLLVIDGRQRILRWGRSFGLDRATRMMATWSADRVQTSYVSMLARRIGVAALGIALALPAVVPGLHGPLGQSGGGGTGTGGHGGSTITTFNPIVRIRDQLHTAKPIPVLTLRSDDEAPDYLRLTALDRFDGGTWSGSPISADSRARVSRGMPGVVSVAQTKTTHSSIKVQTLDVHWLPVPYPPKSVKVKGDWRYDAASGTVFSSRATTRKLSYEVTSARLQPTPEQLAKAPDPDRLDPDLALPALPTQIIDEARRVTAPAATLFDKALALQHYFTGGRFTYDESVPAGDSVNALSQFLFETRRGFCEQFAAAMAVMARAVGIPARVAVGFTAGSRRPDGSWLVTTHDAHAWPELRFAGIGWVRFEPTPSGGADGSALPPSYALATSTSGQVTPGTDTPAGGNPNRPSGIDQKRALLDRGDRVLSPSSGAAPARRNTHTGRVVLVVVLLVLLLLAVPALTRLVVRRRRWRRATTPVGMAHAAWDDLRDDARDLGLQWRPSDTPRTTVASIAAAVGGWSSDTAAAARRLVQAEERASYAASGPGEVGTLKTDLSTVRSAIAREVGTVRRVRAVVLPRSSVQRFGAVGRRATDALDRSEIAVAGMRTRLTPRQRVGR
jgi:transglutaminase-like putative cysteine protease